MFEWLEQEIFAIKTPRFHIVEGVAETKLLEAVVESNLPLPSSYKKFVLKFGNAKLYRRVQSDSYRIGIFAGPREAVFDGCRIYHVGFHEGASVYLKSTTGLIEEPIYEFEQGLEEKAANNFEEWLSASCDAARRMYGKQEWADILHGPAPFNVYEKAIIEARKLMLWKMIGIDSSGNHVFEVTNSSGRRLNVLTVGCRSKDGRLNGTIRLNVQDVAPEQTKRLHVSCYKGLVLPEQVEVFALPDPNPEDRDYYWEFRKEN